MPLAAYCFLRVVGKGSYGEVSLVQHRQDAKQYVIKKLNLKNASKRDRKAAEQEAQLLSLLRHPNIVTYRESWEGEDGLLYIVMGFCEGGDLYHKLKEQKGKLLPETRVVEWFVQIAMALQYLHEKHILHRDLKTQNVFLTRTNIIKVGDLGIARVLENQYDMANTLIGTPYYMSPELLSSKPYNYKSDVWALGCCVYEMATLKHAFNAKDMNSLVYQIIEGKLPPMPKDYSPQLVELIRTMLRKKPEERPSVKNILRQPYIKHQISLFLEATKVKAAKTHRKMADPKPKSPAVVLLKMEYSKDNSVPQRHSSEQARKYKANEEKYLIKDKAVDICHSEKTASEPEKKPIKNEMNNKRASIATVSKVDIDILLSETRNCKNDCSVQDNKMGNLSIPSDAGIKVKPSGPQMEDSGLQQNINPGLEAESGDPKKLPVGVIDESHNTLKLMQTISGDQKQIDKSLDYTEKLMAPFVPIIFQDEAVHGKPGGAQEKITSHLKPHSSASEPSLSRQRRKKKKELADICSEKFSAIASQPLPSPPDVDVKITQSHANQHVAEVSDSVNSIKNSQMLISEDRPLSARERRRLKQSQEEMFPSVSDAKRTSHNAVAEAKLHVENRIKVSQSSTESSISQKKKTTHCLSDDEMSSSTSSTDKSDGDFKAGKKHTNEMDDLVQLMTWTLKMDSKENCEHPLIPTPESEFKFQKKYRDTLILCGKASNEPEEFRFEEFPSDALSGPKKIKRMVEVLRSDVVRGLGVKLLEKVYDIMEEEDELKRELREHMGEKYTNYSVKARHLKFLEDNVKF
ncbi:serine/threonine-protein kinase Nek4 isoform X2 [Alligator sinensis]|uniref:Serine/threonine-protein kinase Nek4 n=1 Tax=Alligator sinensis TaxID=38654 RepID=A0A1U8D7V0_ALLSI|nr:serine/threonine-protein kinase Nek4 isoform X2 [Alligator sinensis]XP_025062557.1 serine/threonine-protein kinase Nek4 isoform X2 [Alligator sinensis]